MNWTFKECLYKGINELNNININEFFFNEFLNDFNVEIDEITKLFSCRFCIIC